MAAPPFKCRRCGQCCYGRGGVRLDEKEAAAAAALLGLTDDEFRRHLAPGPPPWVVPTGPDGYCLFHQRGLCRLQGAKPAVCRLWPYLEGPLKVESAFWEAKAACPGVRPDLSWAEFKRAADDFFADDFFKGHQ